MAHISLSFLYFDVQNSTCSYATDMLVVSFIISCCLNYQFPATVALYFSHIPQATQAIVPEVLLRSILSCVAQLIMQQFIEMCLGQMQIHGEASLKTVPSVANFMNILNSRKSTSGTVAYTTSINSIQNPKNKKEASNPQNPNLFPAPEHQEPISPLRSNFQAIAAVHRATTNQVKKRRK